MSLALSLCQYVFASEREGCHNQDKKVQEASFGVRFLHLKLI